MRYHGLQKPVVRVTADADIRRQQNPCGPEKFSDLLKTGRHSMECLTLELPDIYNRENGKFTVNPNLKCDKMVDKTAGIE